MGLGAYAPAPWAVIIATSMAVAMCVAMYLRGHNYMMIPIAFSIGWIGFGYLLGQLGVEHEDTSAVIRSGIIILCADIVVGGLIWLRGKHHEHR